MTPDTPDAPDDLAPTSPGAPPSVRAVLAEARRVLDANLILGWPVSARRLLGHAIEAVEMCERCGRRRTMFGDRKAHVRCVRCSAFLADIMAATGQEEG